jgi:DNA-binding transcriptional regulator YiaG
MKKYQDESAKTVYEMAEGFYKLGLIDAKRMHEYDVACLVPSAIPHRETASVATDSHVSARRSVDRSHFVEQTAPDVAVASARA